MRFGVVKMVDMLDGLKKLGFGYVTCFGFSIGIDDLVVLFFKVSMVKKANDDVIWVE